jgi:hypothetical protein
MTERERLQGAFLSGDRFGHAEVQFAKHHSRSRESLWRGAIETAKSLECNLATSPETLAHNLGRLRALFLELALAQVAKASTKQAKKPQGERKCATE